MSANLQEAVALLYEALHETVGIVIETDNVSLAIQRLNKAKREDSTLAVIQIRQSPAGEPGEIWLTRKVQREETDGKAVTIETDEST